MNHEQNQSSKQQQKKHQVVQNQQQQSDHLTEFASEDVPSAAITNPKLNGRNKPQ